SQVAGGAGRNQEAEPLRRLQALPHRTPDISKRAAANVPITQCSAVRCQASGAGRCLMVLVPSILSGNELRVKAMAGRHTQTCVHKQDPAFTAENRKHFLLRDWIQSIMQMVHRRREGGEGDRRSNRKTVQDVTLHSVSKTYEPSLLSKQAFTAHRVEGKKNKSRSSTIPPCPSFTSPNAVASFLGEQLTNPSEEYGKQSLCL
ncbi:hypothetical protein CRENBAI_023518, partial [Crenichthys baileyi]